MVKCPRCRMDVPKATREWDYAAFRVKMYDCEKCEKTFKAYYHKGKLSHTIPKSG